MSKVKVIIIAIISFVFCYVTSLSALELQIEDSSKLVRAIAEIQNVAKVEIELSGVYTELLLENLDGLKTTLTGVKLKQTLHLFEEVPAGNWRIKVKPKDVKIIKVKVTEED